MGLRKAPAPKRHASIVEASHEHLKHAEVVNRKSKARSKELSDKLKVEYHMPVVTIGLDNLAQPKALSRARTTSWKYVVRAHGHLAMIDIGAGADANDFQKLHLGSSTERMLKRIEALDKHTKRHRHNYRLQLLRVPGLHFSSLWLKADGKKRHIFMPLESTHKALRVGRRYSHTEVESTLRVEAERALKFSQD